MERLSTAAVCCRRQWSRYIICLQVTPNLNNQKFRSWKRVLCHVHNDKFVRHSKRISRQEYTRKYGKFLLYIFNYIIVAWLFLMVDVNAANMINTIQIHKINSMPLGVDCTVKRILNREYLRYPLNNGFKVTRIKHF